MVARDHGGGLDAAVRRFGGLREDWLDLSTGINPVPYPIGDLPARIWADLPDAEAQSTLLATARMFWQVPEEAAILPASGASALIARLPALALPGTAHIPGPTYNEHAASFVNHGWNVVETTTEEVQARVIVHPNNPTGHFHGEAELGAPLTVIDESFCDVAPERSLIAHSVRPGHLVLKSFGKFWGLAGLRLGFAIGPESMIARLAEMLGPWPVSGPALHLGARALGDGDWVRETRIRLNEDAARLDAIMRRAGAEVTGGTPLFRLYRVDNAVAWQERLGEGRVLGRIFPYATDLLRLGLPPPGAWDRLEAVL